jgi:hypothetical protein
VREPGWRSRACAKSRRNVGWEGCSGYAGQRRGAGVAGLEVVPGACSAGGTWSAGTSEFAASPAVGGAPRHSHIGTDRGAGDSRDVGGSACKQKLVHRPNRRECIVSRIVLKELEICWSARTVALDKGKGGFIKVTCRETTTRLDERSRKQYPL